MIVRGLRITATPSRLNGPRFADVLVPEAAIDLPPKATLGSVVRTASGDLAGATDLQALRTREGCPTGRSCESQT